MSAETYGPVEYDAGDYDTIAQIAERAAVIFAAMGWTYAEGVPDAASLAKRIGDLYAYHAEHDDCGSIATGRFIVEDQNPHDGTPVLYEGIRVLLNLGELPPLRGDLLDDGPELSA